MTNGIIERTSISSKVKEFLGDRGIEAYVVGGYVRDSLLNRDTGDVDIAVKADALEIARGLADYLGGRYVPLDESHQVARIVLVDGASRQNLDFSGYSDDIAADLGRRDFTIDAMAVEINQWPEGFVERYLIDPFNGYRDLVERKLRVVRNGVFRDDPARLLRGVRLAGELDMTIEENTKLLLRRDADLLIDVPGERIREELVRLLDLPKASVLLQQIDELSMLTVICPELESSRGFSQPPEHYWDVLSHSLNAVAAVEFLLNQGKWEFGNEEILSHMPWSESLAQHFESSVTSDSNRAVMLKLAALFHDVSKPQTMTVDDDGRWRFLGHAKEGALITRSVLERLRFSKREVALAEIEVYYHLRPAQMSTEGLPTRRAIFRYFRDTDGAGIDILYLALADFLATLGPHLDVYRWRRQTQLVDYVLSEFERQENISVWPRLIDGHDIINLFGIEPGPRLGRLLGQVQESQAAGEVTTREQAIDLVRRQLTLDR
ncbi:HDIG domain-containing metalloprotein [Chloroflexota bacterium]